MTRIRSKGAALVLGLLTIAPLIYFFVFAVLLMSALAYGGAPPTQGALVAAHVLTGVVLVSLMLFYALHVVNNSSLNKDERALWGIAVIAGASAGMGAYWYLHIWKPLKRGT